MDLGSRRSKVPLWPPSKHGAYQNLSSGEDLPLQDTPQSSTPGMYSARKSLLTPGLTPSPFNTPGLDSTKNTPYLEASPGDLRYDSEAPRKRWFGYGWRGGARLAFYATVVVLLVNVTLIVYMTTAFEKMDGFPVIYRGTCESAERQNSIWHFVINALSTTLLAASNYCMQLLSAPTRANIDRAHGTGHWLDIGIPSIRNLRFLTWTRKFLWILLCISSIPLHLVYNSSFYAAIATNNYNVLYATEDFANGGGYDANKFPDSAAQNISGFHANVSNWKVLDNRNCIEEYAHDFVTTYRNVVTIVANVTSDRDDSLLEVVINELPPNGELGPSYDSFKWICNDTQTTNKTGVTDRNSAGFVPCAAQAPALAKLSDTWWKSGGYQISHCIAETVPADCHLHFSPHLMGPVILMNIVKCLVAFYVAFRMLDVPLVTMGDAIESFIKYPDPTTTGMCLLSSHDAERMFSKSMGRMTAPPAKAFDAKPKFFRKVVTKRQWALILTLMAVMLVGLISGLYFGIKALAPPTLANGWSIGLGQVQTQNLVLGANLPQLGASAVLITALVANAPQALLSFLYMVYNTIFTLMSVGEDWDRFGAYSGVSRASTFMLSKTETHRYLRVSNPRGNQRSTHFLNLPFRYGILLICVSGLLHWLMSQSLYLANISVIPRDGTLPRHDEITTVAFAPQGMIWLCVVAILMLSVVSVNGLRRFGGHMVIVGSNSAAISAACHVENLSEKRRREMVLRKIAWGELPSSGETGTPAMGRGHRRSETATSQENEMAMGLGIAGDGMGGKKITVHDFTGVEHDDVESRGGYQALRGQVEMTDSRGFTSSAEVAHCSFSDSFVFRPEAGKLYA